MKTPFRFLALAPVLTLGFSGCQNLIKPSDTTTTFYKDQVKATVQVSESVNTVAKAIAPDSDDVKKRVAEIEQENKKLKDEITAAKADADQANKKIVQNLADVGGEVVKVVGAFSGQGALAGKVSDFIAGIAKDQADAVEKKVTSDENEKLAKLRENLREEMNQRIKLTDSQQSQFRDEIAKIGKERGFSADEIKKLQETDISTLLLTGGSAGSIALLALLRTLGSSRAAPVLAKQEEKISTVDAGVTDLHETCTDLKKSLDQAQAKLAQIDELKKNVDELYDKERSDVVALAEHKTTLDDHEMRLTKEEARA